MKLNIMSGYIPLEEFLEMMSFTSNLKDIHLLCHQAGCPVYVVRDTSDKCAILWHPCIDEEKNIIHIAVNDGIFELVYNGKIKPFDTIENLQKGIIANCMLGTTPFDTNYLIWDKSTSTSTKLE